MSVRAFIGLGSNLENPRLQIENALSDLNKIEGTRVIKNSGLFQSPPMGPQDQPDYINAVALLETDLEAESLLDQLQSIENRHGRVRSRHWGERTLDLDILLYGHEQICTARLTVPHQGLAEREFVLYPLQKIQPDLIVPGKGALADLVKACPASGIAFLGTINDSTP
ncbi:MAG: 2-amino-4-hydroxy-6-hydroxymethyldihydropteridine diphosphokinase [Gammaproteobacteria bacterium]|nr:2-amino-4-hydroxy-6-hydroxymethyldihydropteridine diphosphokinase [Gammaproteobacteria bacterium]